jgi:hypothetical protein
MRRANMTPATETTGWTSKNRLQEFRLVVGRTFGVALGDVGAWAGEEDLLCAGFYDAGAERPRSFAGVVDAAGERLSWWEQAS